LIHKDFSFIPNYEWDKWDIQFLGKLALLYNQELQGVRSSYSEGIVIEAYAAGLDRTQMLISIRISKELISISTWEDPTQNDYVVLVDVLNKKILIDKKERLYRRAEIKFFTNKKTSEAQVY
jgi:hypothetical protein